jgi:CRISPR-associated endonuclease Cas1
MLRSLDDDSHVKTRLCQYETLKTEKAVHIAKQFVLGKLEGQNQVLKKYGLKRHDFTIIEKVNTLKTEDTARLRTRLMSVEGHFSEKYFAQIFSLISPSLRPESRKTFKAYDGINNLFNLAYEVLSWKVQHALVRAKLEPYLGFLHSLKIGRPSLICDFQELYRYLIDDYVIGYCRNLRKKDFVLKGEDYSDKKGKREYLNDVQTDIFMKNLDRLFEDKVRVPRMGRGEQQELETLINEEALLFAQYLRNEKQQWNPRIVEFDICSVSEHISDKRNTY